MNNFIGKVTETERDEIKSLIELKAGLSELLKMADAKNPEVYNKNVKDLGKTSFDIQKWWDDKTKLYDWESKKGFSWEIDFDNCEICLVQK